MGTRKFIASVQYDDLKGGAAADRADRKGPEDWLKANGHRKGDEFLLGISMYAGENPGAHRDPVCVDFLLTTLEDYESVKTMIDSSPGPINVRKVTLSMSLNDFLGLFKRFSVTLSAHGILGEREY